MARLNGDDNESAWADTVRRNLNSAIFSKYWRGKAFNSSKVSKNDDRAQALAVLAGAAPPHVWDDVRKVFAKTEYASPYMERFVLQALCEMNNTQDALNRMRRRYRVMADSVYNPLGTVRTGSQFHLQPCLERRTAYYSVALCLRHHAFAAFVQGVPS